MEQYHYYMIRIQRAPAQSQPEPPLAGVVERLGSGEKQSFGDGTELLRMLNDWTDSAPNMRPDATGGKA